MIRQSSFVLFHLKTKEGAAGTLDDTFVNSKLHQKIPMCISAPSRDLILKADFLPLYPSNDDVSSIFGNHLIVV
jgi:hypothetical protein